MHIRSLRSCLPKQAHDVRISHRGNRFGQRVLGLLFRDVVGVGGQRQNVAAVSEPLRNLDEVDAVGKPLTAAVCRRSCSRTPFVAPTGIPSSATFAGRLARRPMAPRAGRMSLLWSPLRSSGADQSSCGLITWLPCSRRRQRTAVGVPAAGCIVFRWVSRFTASQSGSSTVRRLVLDLGLPVIHSRLRRDFVRCTRTKPRVWPPGPVVKTMSRTSNPLHLRRT
jgi:hypothetical protein